MPPKTYILPAAKVSFYAAMSVSVLAASAVLLSYRVSDSDQQGPGIKSPSISVQVPGPRAPSNVPQMVKDNTTVTVTPPPGLKAGVPVLQGSNTPVTDATKTFVNLVDQNSVQQVQVYTSYGDSTEGPGVVVNPPVVPAAEPQAPAPNQRVNNIAPEDVSPPPVVEEPPVEAAPAPEPVQVDAPVSSPVVSEEPAMSGPARPSRFFGESSFSTSTAVSVEAEVSEPASVEVAVSDTGGGMDLGAAE